MTLADYLTVYLSERPGLGRTYRDSLARAVNDFGAWVGRPPAIAEVDRALLGGWAAALLEAGKRPSTINTKVARVRRLLLAAWDDGILQLPPRRVWRLRENPPAPEAWTLAECRRLLAYLGALPGRVGERPACEWWTALVLALYWTGCRIGALLAVDVADYSPGQGLTARQQKNGRQQWYRLPATCCEAIERILPESGPVFAWPYHPRTLWVHFREFVERAGLPCPRTHGQLFHRLRRTNASYCAAEDPAIAQRQMDHASPETTRRHYVDPRIANQRSAADVLLDPMPPSPPTLRVIG